MIYLDCSKIRNSGYLGSVVTLELLFKEEPSTVAISVFDPSETELLNDEVGGSSSLGRYITYNYQSLITNDPGCYTFTVQATFGSDLYYDKFTFELEELSLDSSLG